MYLISKERYFDIEKEVYYTLEESGTHSFPIRPHSLAESLGITLVRYSNLTPEKYNEALGISEDGYSFYDYKPGTRILVYYLYYNDDKPPARRRWTICHEIGHIQLGHHDAKLSYEVAEQEANYFAKYLLAPYPMILEYGCQNPFDVFDTFDVSYEAACYIWESFLKWVEYRPIDNIQQERKLKQLFIAA